MSSRDEFTAASVSTLARRVAYRCSNPNCRTPTSGPHSHDDKSVHIGVAAHITAASAGGPRFDASLSSNERIAIENGIYLCQACAKLIDSDSSRFTVDLLCQWKRDAEREALEAIGGLPALPHYPVAAGRLHTPIPKIHNLDYEAARAALIESGWQPAMHHWKEGEKFTYGSGKYFWEKGYHEIIDASGTGLAHMWFRFRDVYGNELIVMTAGEGYESGGATVWRWYFDPESQPAGLSERRFEAAVGQLTGARAFIDFIYRNVGAIVWIDISISESEFDGNYVHGSQWFVLYEHIWRELSAGERMGPQNATGVHFTFTKRTDDTDAKVCLMRGLVKVRGYFAVVGTEGPNQGLMSVALKPLNIEDAARRP